MPIKKDWIERNEKNIAEVPEVDGAYELGDEKSEIIYIHGAPNLRQDISQHLNSDNECLAKARFFRYENVFQYTLRESELLQQYMRLNKKMPPGNEEII